MAFRKRDMKVVAIKNFRAPEGARNGDKEGLVRKGQVIEVSVIRAAQLMRKGMVDIHRPVNVAPSVTKVEEPESFKDEEKPKRRRRKEESVDEPDSGSDVS